MIHKKPLVSVCVTTYQHAQYIAQCLDSILEQETNFPFEIIIGEDDSSDGTRDICKVYEENNPDKIRLFLRDRKDVIYINGQATGRYNVIENMKASKGKYIALCEGDDYWNDPLKLQKQVDFLESNPSYVISGHDAKILGSDNKFRDSKRLGENRKRDFTAEELMSGKQIITLTMCFRNVIKEFPPEFYKSLNADSFLVSLLGEYGGAKFQDNIKDGVYRMHAGGIWSLKSKIYQLKNQRNSYHYMFLYHKRKNNQVSSNNIFRKYYNVSKTLIGKYIEAQDYKSTTKVLFSTVFNTIKKRNYHEALSLLRFVFIKSKAVKRGDIN